MSQSKEQSCIPGVTADSDAKFKLSFCQRMMLKFVRGFFAIGQLAVRKNV